VKGGVNVMRNTLKKAAALSFFCLFVASLAAQTPFVKITSPASGTVVHPGESLTINVDATPSAFRTIFVVPFASLMDKSSKSPHYVVTIQIPSDLASAAYPVGVIGVPMSGAIGKNEGLTGPDRDSIMIDVERSESPKRLSAKLLDLYNVPDGFHHVGEIRRLYVTGTFADGTKVLLSRSKLTTYEIDPPGVVTANEDGMVTAISSGSAEITVQNGDATVVIVLTVP